jgi:hypothetical protein
MDDEKKRQRERIYRQQRLQGVVEVSDNRRKQKRKEGGTPPERGKENGAEGSQVPIKTGWFSETIRTSTMK